MEEDIKILEEKIKNICKSGKRIKLEDIKNIYSLFELISHVLKRNKELEEENKNYKRLYININGMRNGKELLIKYINDSILKSAIKEKIEELLEDK
jgi:hypothetical protein